MSKPAWEGRAVDRYQLIRRIGRGGMGEVYLAELEPVPGVKKLAAVKLLREVGLEPAIEKSFAAEAKLAALISHPNVVQLLDAGVSDEMPWLAMEFVAGLSLHELLLEAKSHGGSLPPWVAARIIADACAGLHAVHDATNERGEPLGIVHRDVTPHNVLIGWDGTVKITDFGVARSALQSTVTRTGTVKGKLSYMAPEQASGTRVDKRADVFALGILLFEALSGKKLFKAANATETLARVLRCEVPPLESVAPKVPPALAAIAGRALSADPAARFQTAREMQRALEAAMRSAGVDLGAAEVSEVLAALVPSRVREHEAWLRERSETPSVVTTPPPSESTLMTVETVDWTPALRKRRRVVPLFALGAALALGIGIFAWSRAQPSAPAIPSSQAPAAPPAPAEVTLRPEVERAAQPVPSVPASSIAPRTSKPPPPAPRELGKLHVGSSPVWATVLVDGRSVGATPIAGIELPAGTHVVEARPQGKGPGQRRSVRVPPNGSASVHFRFE